MAFAFAGFVFEELPLEKRLVFRHLIVLKFFKNTTKKRFYSKPIAVLGIETSCDDTGAAIISPKGKIVGEAVHSQTRISTLLVNLIIFF